jgi:hypothetical protein
MTPFESATNFVHSLAQNLYASYAMLNYLPVLDELERESASALLRGDMQAATTIAIVQSRLNQDLSASAFEA